MPKNSDNSTSDETRNQGPSKWLPKSEFSLERKSAPTIQSKVSALQCITTPRLETLPEKVCALKCRTPRVQTLTENPNRQQPTTVCEKEQQPTTKTDQQVSKTFNLEDTTS